MERNEEEVCDHWQLGALTTIQQEHQEGNIHFTETWLQEQL